MMARTSWLGEHMFLREAAGLWTSVKSSLWLCCVCVCVCVSESLSHVQLFATPWTVAHRAPLSMKFSRQEYWSGLPYPPPGDLPDPGTKPRSPALQADSLPSKTSGKPMLTACNPLFEKCITTSSSSLSFVTTEHSNHVCLNKGWRGGPGQESECLCSRPGYESAVLL